MMKSLSRIINALQRFKNESVTDASADEWQGSEYLRKWILKGVCPVCGKPLGTEHAVAHVGSCNFSGPNVSNGFLQEVKERRWSEVAQPFYRITSMDLMSCELVRCSAGLAVVVWVEVDLGIGGDQYMIHSERIAEVELTQIESITKLIWVPFRT